MEDFRHLRGTALVLLTSRDPASGAAVHRPVRMSFDSAGDGLFAVLDGGPLARRLAACPDVRLARSDLRGRPGGSDQPGRVVRDDTPVAGPVAAVIASTGRGRLVRYRVTPAPEPTPWTAAAAAAGGGAEG